MRIRAISMGAIEHASLQQIDTYFHAKNGRLKLRQQTGKTAKLIWYDRVDSEQPKQSEYQLVEIPDPSAMIAVLTESLGLRIEVSKHREVLLWRNVRIHLDQVDRLGTFIEFEAVVSDETSEEQSRENLQLLRMGLEIREADLIAKSYSDLLEQL